MKDCRIGTSPVTFHGACQYPCLRQRIRCFMDGSITTSAISHPLSGSSRTSGAMAKDSGTNLRFTISLERTLSTTTTSSCQRYVLASIQNTSFQNISLQGVTLCCKTKRYQRAETGILA